MSSASKLSDEMFSYFVSLITEKETPTLDILIKNQLINNNNSSHIITYLIQQYIIKQDEYSLYILDKIKHQFTSQHIKPIMQNINKNNSHVIIELYFKNIIIDNWKSIHSILNEILYFKQSCGDLLPNFIKKIVVLVQQYAQIAYETIPCELAWSIMINLKYLSLEDKQRYMTDFSSSLKITHQKYLELILRTLSKDIIKFIIIPYISIY